METRSRTHSQPSSDNDNDDDDEQENADPLAMFHMDLDDDDDDEDNRRGLRHDLKVKGYNPYQISFVSQLTSLLAGLLLLLTVVYFFHIWTSIHETTWFQVFLGVWFLVAFLSIGVFYGVLMRNSIRFDGYGLPRRSSVYNSLLVAGLLMVLATIFIAGSLVEQQQPRGDTVWVWVFVTGQLSIFLLLAYLGMIWLHHTKALNMLFLGWLVFLNLLLIVVLAITVTSSADSSTTTVGKDFVLVVVWVGVLWGIVFCTYLNCVMTTERMHLIDLTYVWTLEALWIAVAISLTIWITVYDCALDVTISHGGHQRFIELLILLFLPIFSLSILTVAPLFLGAYLERQVNKKYLLAYNNEYVDNIV